MLTFNEDNPTQLHMSAAKRVLQYMTGTTVEVVMMHPGKEDQVTAFADVSCRG